ncbi:transposase [Halopseudomonas maritima]|uniref:transposase n=1 Tax=Halopseudomonas maritima TaxID=2918528 RepID=UPI001EEC1999|nr:transposase [Halopseudomonas maritima]UJJ32067.1 transposase [Halopseudomonas maritima]
MSIDDFKPRFTRTEIWKGWQRTPPKPERQIPYDLQLITLRLADSLPASAMLSLQQEVRAQPPQERVLYRRKRLDHYLQQGHGCCLLKHPKMAAELADALESQNRKRYKLIAWCIMPNHAQILLEPTYATPRIIQGWKTATTHWMQSNKEALALETPGRLLWMRDYWDRYIKDEQDLHQSIQELHGTPVSAGLCEQPQQWRWSSAYESG